MALRAVVFDVGETLVDEERWRRRPVEREGLQPGCAPRDVAYVGDRVDNDLLPAAAAGLIAVHVRRGPWGRLQHTEATLGLDDLSSLPDSLASLT